MEPSSERPSRRQRWISRGFASALLLFAVGSCTSVLDLGQYANVAEEMCTLLDRCYAKSENLNCLPNLEGRLTNADAAVRTDWLSLFTSYGCLDSCGASRKCLDTAPLCGYKTTCKIAEECCGSLSGHASCTDGHCCTNRGSSCKADDDCCFGAGACDPVVHTCGGTHCSEASAACTVDSDCCTEICNHGACSDTTCSKNLFECEANEECCSLYCDQDSKRCAPPKTCAAVNQACSLDTDCCDGNACYIKSGDLTGTCSTAKCAVALVDCSADDQCCTGRCDPLGFYCVAACLKEGRTCANEGECCTGQCDNGLCAGQCSTGACVNDGDCCTKSCIDGACAAACNPVESHNPCLTGGPLADPAGVTGCVAEVCAADPYCCCGAWDDICVTAAVAKQTTCLILCH